MTVLENDNQKADATAILDPVFLFQGLLAGARIAGQRKTDQT